MGNNTSLDYKVKKLALIKQFEEDLFDISPEEEALYLDSIFNLNGMLYNLSRDDISNQIEDNLDKSNICDRNNRPSQKIDLGERIVEEDRAR